MLLIVRVMLLQGKVYTQMHLVSLVVCHGLCWLLGFVSCIQTLHRQHLFISSFSHFHSGKVDESDNEYDVPLIFVDFMCITVSTAIYNYCNLMKTLIYFIFLLHCFNQNSCILSA
jgi:hypothetical protein